LNFITFSFPNFIENLKKKSSAIPGPQIQIQNLNQNPITELK